MKQRRLSRQFSAKDGCIGLILSVNSGIWVSSRPGGGPRRAARELAFGNGRAPKIRIFFPAALTGREAADLIQLFSGVVPVPELSLFAYFRVIKQRLAPFPAPFPASEFVDLEGLPVLGCRQADYGRSCETDTFQQRSGGKFGTFQLAVGVDMAISTGSVALLRALCGNQSVGVSGRMPLSGSKA